MSATQAAHAETLRYRATLEANAARAAAMLLRAWAAVDPDDIDRTVLSVLPTSVAAIKIAQQQAVDASCAYVARFVAAELALDAVRFARRMDTAGVDRLPGTTLAGRTLIALAGWSRVQMKLYIQRGAAPDAAVRAALASTQSLARTEMYRVAQKAVRAVSAANPEHVAGWRRTPSRRACSFCLSLVKGVEAHDQSDAAFTAHRNCGCTAEPAARGVDSAVFALSG